MKILIIDNYDSFTYNLVHYCELYCDEVVVRRNDEVLDSDIDTADKIILSPGPGLPADAGRMPEIIEKFHTQKPILGVCLGLQAIVEFFGGKLKNLEHVLHGKSTVCIPEESTGIFQGLPSQFQVGHYHSWVADESSFPSELIITSRNENGLIMSLRHQELPLIGVQFHPESIMTEHGKKIIENWVSRDTIA